MAHQIAIPMTHLAHPVAPAMQLGAHNNLAEIGGLLDILLRRCGYQSLPRSAAVVSSGDVKLLLLLLLAGDCLR